MRRKEKLSRYKEETLNERNNLGKSESIEKRKRNRKNNRHNHNG